LIIFPDPHSQEDPWVRAAAAAGALTASPLAHAPAPITHGAQQRRMAQLDYRYLHDPALDGGSFDASASAASAASSSSSSQPQPPRNRQTVALASTLCLSPRHMTTTATTVAAAAVNLAPTASVHVVSPAAAATGAAAASGVATGAAATKAFFNHVPPPPGDAFSALLPKSAVPHITGNFISWGAPLPMIPLVRARASRTDGHEHHQSSSSSSPDPHGDEADAAGGDEGGDSGEGGGGSPSSSPQAAPRVRIDAKFAGASPPSAASSSSTSASTVNGMRSPRPQMLRGLDPSVGEEAVLTAADRDEYIERGAYSIDLWMPPGAELLFRCAHSVCERCVSKNRQITEGIIFRQSTQPSSDRVLEDFIRISIENV
jgi:hypothetical protein